MGKPEKDEDLVELARSELLKCEGKWTHLSTLTKRKLSYRWLTSFANSEIKDPGASKLLLLCKYIGIKVSHAPGPHFLRFEVE